MVRGGLAASQQAVIYKPTRSAVQTARDDYAARRLKQENRPDKERFFVIHKDYLFENFSPCKMPDFTGFLFVFVTCALLMQQCV